MMAGYTLLDLPRPKKGYRPSVDTRRADGVVRFESFERVLKEDALRARLIRRAMKAHPELFGPEAIDLMNQLWKGVRTQVPPPTLASAQFMRIIRNLVIGNVWPWVEDIDLQPAVTATLLPTGMWVPASELPNVDPRKMMARLKSDLHRTGITGEAGYLIAGLNAEFDVRRQGYDFHYHLIAGGWKARSLQKLRDLPKYSDARREPHEVGLNDISRVRISQEWLHSLPNPLTYILQFWCHTVQRRSWRASPSFALNAASSNTAYRNPTTPSGCSGSIAGRYLTSLCSTA